MTSSLQSDTECRFRALLVSVLLGCIACSRDKEDRCADSAPPAIDLPSELKGEVVLFAELSVDEWVEVDTDGKRKQGGMLGANFADMSGYSDEKIDAIPFGQACVAEVGQHVINTSPEPIGAGGVIFRGVGSKEIRLEKDQEGQFKDELMEGSLFSDDGGEKIEVEVLQDKTDTAFPAFAVGVTEPRSVELVDIETDSDGSLRIEWEASDSTYFEIALTAKTADPNLPPNRIRCLTEDDGCQVVPADAIEWLLSQGAKEAAVKLKRHVLAHEVPAEGALAELDAMRTLEFFHVF